MGLYNNLGFLLDSQHRLNMELDLQSTVYLGSMCAQLIGSDPAPLPHRIWTHIRGRCWSAKIDDISL
jgi:hypothetical protein